MHEKWKKAQTAVNNHLFRLIRTTWGNVAVPIHGFTENAARVLQLAMSPELLQMQLTASAAPKSPRSNAAEDVEKKL